MKSDSLYSLLGERDMATLFWNELWAAKNEIITCMLLQVMLSIDPSDSQWRGNQYSPLNFTGWLQTIVSLMQPLNIRY